ncbi:hypothetical protein EDD85DRAFT_1029984 [Armillaria nabsnona]|nr:hypothetical protein EDD85DRAFT_1029984 [Armillaria nabsnona]
MSLDLLYRNEDTGVDPRRRCAPSCIVHGPAPCEGMSVRKWLWKRVKRLYAGCLPPGQPIPFLRGYNPDDHAHYYTTSAQEMEDAITPYKHKSQGDACLVFDFQAPGTVPFYRLRQPSAADNFYTTDENERDNSVKNLGYFYKGIAAYIYPYTVSGSIPLYRLYNPTVVDHFYTADANEKDTATRTGG